MPKPSSPLETVTCSRCGGSGQYSYCQSYGTRCFKCHGSGYVYSKRGLVARDYLRLLRSKPVEAVAVGDLIEILGVPEFTVTRFERITEINPHAISEGSSLIDGVMVPYRRECFEVVTTGTRLCGIYPGTLYRMGQTAEQKAETMARALAYQSTLTKDGKPRKRAGIAPSAPLA